MKHHHLLLLLVLLTAYNAIPQQTNPRADSLLTLLNNVEGNEKVDLLNKLAKEEGLFLPDQGLQFAKEALQLSIDENYKNGEALANSSIGESYRRLGILDSALQYQTQALQKFKIINDQSGIAKVNGGIGIIYLMLDDKMTALDYYFNALEFWESTTDKKPLAITNYMIGVTYSFLYSYEKSTTYLLRAIEISKEIDNKHIIASANDVIANNFAGVNDFDNAIVFQQEAMKIHEETGDDKEAICISKMNLAVTYQDMKMYSEAMKLLHECAILANESGFKQTYADCLSNIGSIYSEEGKYDSALYYTEQGLKIHTEIKAAGEISVDLLNLGAIYLKTNKPDKADNYFQCALELSKETNNYGNLKFVYENIAELNSRKGSYKKAFENYKLFKVFSDSILSKDNRDKLTELNIVYQTEKKEKENQLLQQEVHINEITINQKNRLILIFIIVIAVIILLMAVIYYFYQQKSKAYGILVRENLKSLEIEKKFEKCIVDTPLQTSSGSDSDTQNNMLRQKFEKFMVEEKPYLWVDVNMDEFCVKLNTNRTYLSKLINNFYDQSFTDLLFEYRIRAARELLSDPSKTHLSVEGIGELAGFKSNATFHQKFKSMLNLTPQLFRSKALKRTA